MKTESLLQFIWQYALFQSTDLRLVDGRGISILQKGQLNTDSGPDFFAAKIKIDDTIWVGNIELHIQSSDWLKHGHQNDSNYQNIILHVVYKHDKNIDSGNFPVLELQPYIAQELIDKYDTLMDTRPLVACAARLKQVPDLIWSHWLERMLSEKWEQKFQIWQAILNRNNGDFSQLFYLQLARTMGGKVNADAMQQLASITPLHILAKHKTNLAHIEAILLGQANLLPQEAEHPYETELKVHYAFFRQKYNLTPMEARNWKFMRMRPAGFPTIRIAQLAMIIHQHEHLFSKLMQLTELQSLKDYFNLGASDYWHEHYTFQQKSVAKDKNTGATLQQLIWINVVAPLNYFYANVYGLEKEKNNAAEFLRHCKAEQNSIIKIWKNIDIKVADAAQSQALIYLYNEYCSAKRCLHCSVGHWMLK